MLPFGEGAGGSIFSGDGEERAEKLIADGEAARVLVLTLADGRQAFPYRVMQGLPVILTVV